MVTRARFVALGLLLVLGLSGCPVKDDYFIDASLGSSTAGSESEAGGASIIPEGGNALVMTGQAGKGAGGGGTASGTAGSADSGGDIAGGGMPDVSNGGAASCEPTTERCNGHDDNCNDVVDEQACNSMLNGTLGCAGFVLSDRPEHGYMLCSVGTRDYQHAQEACQAQNMRLAWLESAEENTEVAGKVAAISTDVEVWIGGTDAAVEGKWLWDGQGGIQFWSGSETGRPVGNAFVAWADGTPNNDGMGEDCAVLIAESATWGDRSCSVKYAYLCEETEP